MNLIEELTALQERHGYLRDIDLRELSARTHAPLYAIQGLCTFYPHFRRQPPAQIEVRGCRDLACHLRDGDRALADLHTRCQKNDDVHFETVSCLGRCDLAPACTLNEVAMTADDVQACLEAPGSRPIARSPARGGFELDPYGPGEDHYGVLAEWLAATPQAIVERLESSGLRGMGGAGFPTGRKWKLVAAEPARPRYVICNADESEPGTFKDREVLAGAPHLVLEGMVLSGLAIGSHEGWVYIRHEYGPEREALEQAIARAREDGVLGERVLGRDFAFDVKVFVSPGGYILGEETALLEAMEGRRGEPRNRPPYPGIRGLHGKPTLINNVETFAQVPRALREGEVATKLFSVSGDVERPAVVEAPFGTTVAELISRCGGMKEGRKLLAFLPGGASTGFLSAEHEHLPLDWDPLREAGSALGSAAVIVVAEGADLLDLAGNLTAFFRNESCGKCVPCRIGTEKAVRLIAARDPLGLERLRELDETLASTSICGLGHAALTPIISVLDRFEVDTS
ncbi:MAG: NAD(P)H-dependent oxidoreductase subunit E [Myxococcota bacterium]|nr:NAD(P)H-dependent oxidoreductase subunit E [Myxococcota bacterium]